MEHEEEAPAMESPTTALGVGGIHVSALTPEQQQQRAMALAVRSDSDRAMALFERAFEAGGATPEALAQLVALKTQIDERSARLEFAEALREFQRRCPVIPHNKKASIASNAGGGFSYTYADWYQIRKYALPIMVDLGLSDGYNTEIAANGNLVVIGTLRHINGHSVESRFTLPIASRAGMSDQQKVSSAATFGKRVVLTDLLGITTSSEPDLDGGDPSQQELISEEQVATLSALRDEVKANGPKFLAWLGIASLGELPASRYKEAVTALETMRRKP